MSSAPKTLLWIILAALLLHAPMVSSGPMADDYIQRMALEQPGAFGRMGPASLFDFGTRADFEREGHSLLPWFVGDDWRVRFLRPLASLEIALQQRVFGSNEVGRHLVGLALLAAVLAAAWRLFRGLGLSSRAAAIAVCVLGFSDAAVLPIGWAANRSSAWCLLLVLLALDAAGRRGPLLALALACAATLFKESGLVAFPLIGLRLFGAGSPAHPRRVAYAGTSAALVGLYLASYLYAGYGTTSAMYAAPWSAPLRFAGHLAVLCTAGGASLAGPFPVDQAGLEPSTAWAVGLAGLAVLAGLARVLHRDLRGHPATLLLIAATLLALAPEAGAAPSDRLLWPATAGAAGLLGIALDRRLARWRSGSSRARFATAALLLSATLLSGLSTAGLGLLHRRLAASTRAIASDSTLGNGPRDVLILQASNAYTAFIFPPMYASIHGDREARFQSLQVGRQSLRMTRTGERSAIFEAAGPLLTGPFERLYLTQDAASALPVGTVCQAGELRFEVLEVEAGGPTRVALSADRSLDAPDLLLAVQRGERFEALVLPAPGESLDLPAPPPALPLVP